jgi:hypothetical protein
MCEYPENELGAVSFVFYIVSDDEVMDEFNILGWNWIILQSPS